MKVTHKDENILVVQHYNTLFVLRGVISLVIGLFCMNVLRFTIDGTQLSLGEDKLVFLLFGILGIFLVLLGLKVMVRGLRAFQITWTFDCQQTTFYQRRAGLGVSETTKYPFSRIRDAIVVAVARSYRHSAYCYVILRFYDGQSLQLGRWDSSGRRGKERVVEAINAYLMRE